MGRLFGTDGVRGRAGDPPLDVATIRRVGASLVRALRKGTEPSVSAEGSRETSPKRKREDGIRFLAGRDTRESGSWIERELAFGIVSQGGTLTGAGIVPTPAVAYLTSRMGYT